VLQGTTRLCRKREVCTVRYLSRVLVLVEVNATIGYYEDNSRRGKRSRSGTISKDTRKSVRNMLKFSLLCGASTLAPLLYLLLSPTAIALFAIALSRSFPLSIDVFSCSCSCPC
jgi:hypothetical protein